MSSSIKVYLESKKAHTTFNETHKKFKLLNPISIKPNEKIVMNVLDAEIPVSFYNINSNNNNRTISYAISGNKTQTIPEGNYSGEALATLLTTNSLSVSYNELTNKFSFKSSTSAGGTISQSEILGVNSTISIDATGGAFVEGQQQGRFSGINNIFVSIRNIGSQNVDSNGVHTNIVAKIPVDTDFGGVINYIDHHNIFQKLTIKEIHTIDIELLDRDGKALGGDGGLGGLEWNLTLLFSFVEEDENENMSANSLLEKLHKKINNR